jgi:hypothetical protein
MKQLEDDGEGKGGCSRLRTLAVRDHGALMVSSCRFDRQGSDSSMAL